MVSLRVIDRRPNPAARRVAQGRDGYGGPFHIVSSIDFVGIAAEWITVPRSTMRAGWLAIGSGLFYLVVAYGHFWSRPVGDPTWPSLLIFGAAVLSIAAGVSVMRVLPNSWGMSHTFFVIIGLANLALVPLMFDLPVVLAPIGAGLSVAILMSLQTDDAFALAEPEAQAQRPSPVIFRSRHADRWLAADRDEEDS